MSKEINREAGAALAEYFESRREAVVSLTRALVEEESPSGDLAGSRAVVGLLAEEARKIEAVNSVETTPAPDNFGEHLRVRAFGNAGDRGDRCILLLGHTDTVHPRGSIRERPWREADGRIYAPGIFDMKANCALALEALRACAALGLAPSCGVELLLTCDEEVGSMSGRALVEEGARRAEVVLVLEPPASGGRVKTARKGTAGYTLSIEGIAAHAGLDPEKGASAVLEMARQIQRLDALSDSSRGTTLNVGVVAGGTRSNVVAAHARAEIDVRFSTADEARRIEGALGALEPFDPRVRLSVAGGINRPPLERTEAVVRLYEHARSVAAALGYELGETSVGGASDGNFAAALGVPVLDGLGIDGDGAHAAHEHINASDITRRGALVAALIASL
ncbi:MAG TPA: M20 family metallopeptidase [Pyrinomonadaceae bacterium]|jgi:glutamate carboxypeptidase